MTHKRDMHSTCPVCGAPIRQDGIGRMRTYCSDTCRVKGNRRKHSTRRKEINEVRTDYLEMQIGFYQAQYQYDAVAALRSLAREISAPIDAERIAHWKAVYTRSGETPLSFRNTSDAETLRNGITAALAGEVTP